MKSGMSEKKCRWVLKVLNSVLTKKIIVKPGYTSVLDYDLMVYEN